VSEQENHRHKEETDFLRKNRSVRYFVLLGMAIVLNGCASTKPVAEDAVDELPHKVDAVDERTDGLTEAKPGTFSDEAGASRQASADQCEPTEDIQGQSVQADCVDDSASDEVLLDRTQRTVYEVVNGTTRWFDGFFGESQLNDAGHISRGRITVGGFWDQRDQFSSRVNLRAKLALPALKHRTRLVLGRGDADDFIDGTEEQIVEGLPASFDPDRDEDWLIGLGYSRKGNLARGFDLGVGVKVANPLEPYVRLTYRWYRSFGDAWLLRIRPRAFWQQERGSGVTFQSDLDRVINPDVLVRWANSLSVEDEVEGLGWRSDLIAYQGLSNNRALSYSIFALGQGGADVQLQNYGLELRYRQRIAREWLFIQLSTGLSWPRELLEEQRHSNFGVGVMFEMQFGRW
jgi:hypothetical protein